MGFSKEVKKSIKSEYTEKLVRDFYEPVLKEAKVYKRVSGYFSSKGMDLYIEGIEEIAKNYGKLKFIISKNISESDYEKIKSGYNMFEDIKTLNIAERNEKLTTDVQKQLGNLAFMIAMGRARVKIGFSDAGLFHDKFGLIENEEDKVLFVGSVNETHGGIERNYESISVDVSWDESERVKSRMNSYSDRFDRLWNNKEKRATVIEASEIAYEQLAIYQSQVDIEEEPIKDDCEVFEEKINKSILFKLIRGQIIRYDNSGINLTSNDRKLNERSDLAHFFEEDNSKIKHGTSYNNIERIIKVTESRASRRGIGVYVTDAVREFIARNKYSIEQYKIIGDVLQNDIDFFPKDKYKDYKKFCEIVQAEVSRNLLNLHLRAAFYEYEMAKAANFSVPGSGKTAMILGVFAYLNRIDVPENEKIKRILVVSPISAFESWREEFRLVFGSKKDLISIDAQSSSNFEDDLNLKWNISNLVLINYESLRKYESMLVELIDSKTMLVFDEVHRVKNPDGIRAESALNISRKPKFKYVLTGTPIPNSYRDIYNFLNILYTDEYNSYFGWDLKILDNPRIREIDEINQKIHPFFWRTNKKDLNVPEPDTDKLIIVNPTLQQIELAEAIYENERSSLARLIRLIQASTNPSLIQNSINYQELMSYDEEGDLESISESEFLDLLGEDYVKENKYSYSQFNLDDFVTPKFESGIELVEKLVRENKKVLVWGIFIDTLHKITDRLRNLGIKTNLIYGGTDKSERVGLIKEFTDGNVQVLVSNPQTLGESISLHKKVHDAVYFEYNFNLTFMLQSRDRIHRLGLSENEYTRYYYLQTKDEEYTSSRAGYIDQKIYSRLKEKEKIMYKAIDSKDLFVEYSKEEIEEAIEIINEERMRIDKNKPHEKSK